MNAAACWQRLPPCPRCDRPTDRRQSTSGKAPKLCPCTVGRSFPKALSSLAPAGRVRTPKAGGQVSRPLPSLSGFSKGCSASEARQAVGSNSSVVNVRTAQRLSTPSRCGQAGCPARGRGTPFAPRGWGSGGGCSCGALPWHPCGPLLGGLIYIGTAPRARKAQRGHGAPCRGYHSRMTTPTVKIFFLGALGVV